MTHFQPFSASIFLIIFIGMSGQIVQEAVGYTCVVFVLVPKYALSLIKRVKLFMEPVGQLVDLLAAGVHALYEDVDDHEGHGCDEEDNAAVEVVDVIAGYAFAKKDAMVIHFLNANIAYGAVLYPSFMVECHCFDGAVLAVIAALVIIAVPRHIDAPLSTLQYLVDF